MLKKLNYSDFDKIYPIMEESFPTDERRPYDEQKSLMFNPEYSVYAVVDEKTGEVKTFITIWNFEKFAFAEHFATKKEYRGGGTGTLVLNELFDLLKRRVCLEVELPNTDFAKRRIEFYKRNGFSENFFEYVQPPISAGKNAIELRLMTTDGTLTRTEFNEVKKQIFKKVYKVEL